MSLSPYRRHLETCPHKPKGAAFSLCDCPIWCDGTLAGERHRRSLNTTDWATALSTIKAKELGTPAAVPKPVGITVKAAAAIYIASCEARHVRPSTIRSYKRTLATLPDLGLAQLDVEALEAWRAGRKVKAGTQRKELEHVRFFLAWAVGREMVGKNAAVAIKSPKVDAAPTMPYTQDEVTALLRACDRLSSDDPSATPYLRDRARCTLLLLLYSGLRRSDVATLRRDALDERGYLTLRLEKTRVPLKVRLPDEVADECRRLPSQHPDYFFWSGVGKAETVGKNLWRTVSRLGKLAKVAATVHRFRDTFACRLLEHGQDIRLVQKLLGHTSIRTTEKHYAPWVVSHQNLLDSATSTLDFTSPRRKPLVRLLQKRRRNA